MISAVDFEDIFGWSPARASTGLPTPPTAASSARDEASPFEAPASAYVIRELRPHARPEHRDVRTREYASVTA